MFTSRPSDPTVALLWGDRWWIDGHPEPIVFGEPGHAFKVLLAHFAEHGKPAKLRLIYQPPSLVSVPVQCPNGSRATLQAALQAEYPSIAQAECAWSYEPIIGRRNETLLHYEPEPGLLPLVEALREQAVAVEGAWPFATALNLVPEDWPDTGALTVVAVADNQSAVFRHTSEGRREFQSATGVAAAELVATTVQQAFEREDAALYMVSFDEAGTRLTTQVAGAEPFGRADLTCRDVIRAALALSLTQPNQLLPAPMRLTGNRLVTGLTTVVLLAAGVLGAQFVRDTLAQRDHAEQQTTRIEQLRAEVASLRKNEIEIRQLQTQLAAFTSHGRIGEKFLQSLVRRLPAQVVLTRVQANDNGFTLTGGISGPGLVEPDWRAWCETLQRGKPPRQFAEPAGTPPDSDFVMKGIWQ
ncbi:hypothetical protein OH491_01570 [Termitidicoccus mucosus]|uniref:PilN domain-containing protein n=1 Tax=Termitidicoccus mucosus TaxID=1184151 RepID=UPI0011AB40C9